jgi:hypothetical protein
MLAHGMQRNHATLEDDVLLGGLVGVLAGTCLAAWLGGVGGMLAFGATLGLVTGWVAGVLLWLETADLPEDPIPPMPGHRARR